MKSELMNKIDKMIEEKRMKTGAMGTEVTWIEMNLTEEEKEIFQESIEFEKFESDNYNWYFESNTLYLSYSEDPFTPGVLEYNELNSHGLSEEALDVYSNSDYAIYMNESGLFDVCIGKEKVSTDSSISNLEEFFQELIKEQYE